jgi:tRNA A-37 threonylcarbamoyl transferase component Bud32
VFRCHSIDRGPLLTENEHGMTDQAQTECLADKLARGDVVGGKYEVQDSLGRGGMGLVLSAVHQQLHERVALKFLTSSADRVPAARSRFMREARITAKLRGEHAARVSDFGTLDDGTPYMVMEYLDGIDLRMVLMGEQRLPVDLAVHYIVQACEGLAEAHALGIVHRDLKPSNLFLTKRPDGTDLIKIVDFGISKVRSAQDAHDVELTAAGAVLGSPKYVAPEQLRDSGNVDARADVWSLGAILYEMLAGRPPFDGDSTASLCYLILSQEPPPPLFGEVEGVSEALERVVFRCLARDVTERTSDVAALIADLSEATGIDGLDSVAEGVAGMLARGANADGATSAFGLSGSYPRGRRVMSDSGSVRRLDNSSGTQPGLAASQFPVRRKRNVQLILVGLVGLLVALGLVLWSQTSRDGVTGDVLLADISVHGAALPPPSGGASFGDGVAGVAAPAASLSAVPADASLEAGAPDAAEAGGARPPQPRVRPPSTPKTSTPAAPPKDDGKKPLNPFGDRY